MGVGALLGLGVRSCTSDLALAFKNSCYGFWSFFLAKKCHPVRSVRFKLHVLRRDVSNIPEVGGMFCRPSLLVHFLDAKCLVLLDKKLRQAFWVGGRRRCSGRTGLGTSCHRNQKVAIFAIWMDCPTEYCVHPQHPSWQRRDYAMTVWCSQAHLVSRLVWVRCKLAFGTAPTCIRPSSNVLGARCRNFPSSLSCGWT